MTVAVLGVGGVGGMVASRTGALCVATPRTVEAIRANGLTYVCGDVTTVSRPGAVERLEQPVSLLVVAVKAPSLAAALERVAPDAVEGAVVLPLLNGLEHVAVLRSRFPGATVVAGSIGRFEAFSPSPGVIVQRSPGALLRAASTRLAPGELAGRLSPLRVSGIELVIGDDELGVLWEKVARLAVLAAATAATGMTVGPLRTEPAWRRRLDTALGEACAVAVAEGVPLDPAAQWAIIDAMPESLTTSTARDVAAGRASELDAITGAVVRAGERLGIPTPELASLLEDACRAR